MIKFTQFLRPHGQKKPVFIERSPEVESKANQIVLASYRFEIEELTTGEVSMSITWFNPITMETEDVISELVPNGPEVPLAVDRLIKNFKIPEKPTTQ